jgi:hypothetical protein
MKAVSPGAAESGVRLPLVISAAVPITQARNRAAACNVIN